MAFNSLNETGGIFAGCVALLAAAGTGLKWLINYSGRREDSRAAKLQVWHDELEKREARIDAERENDRLDFRNQFEEIRHEHRALFQAYHLLARALIKIDPGNEALNQASALLSAAFKVDPFCPPDMMATLARVK